MLVIQVLFFMLNKEERKILLDLARSSIKGDSSKLKSMESVISENLKKPKGVFVTLTENGELRGCIGNITPVEPLYKAVIDCARDAAYNDWRFPPVREHEIDLLKIEISVLSDLKPLEYSTVDDLLGKLDKSLGVVIEKGMNKATFLPQVWEDLPRKEDFLNQLCIKAGLSPCRAQPGLGSARPGLSLDGGPDELKVYVYTVEKFSEE